MDKSKIKATRAEIGRDIREAASGFPKCPYCRKRVNYFYLWGSKGKGEYLCPHCGEYSNIKMRKAIYFLGLAAVILTAIMLAVFLLTGCQLVWLLIIMIIPFAIFTAVSPFFIKLARMPAPMKKKVTKKTASYPQAKKV